MFIVVYTLTKLCLLKVRDRKTYYVFIYNISLVDQRDKQHNKSQQHESVIATLKYKLQMLDIARCKPLRQLHLQCFNSGNVPHSKSSISLHIFN